MRIRVVRLISLHLYLHLTTAYNLCVHECTNDWSWDCLSSSCPQHIYTSRSNNNCTLFGFQKFNSQTECEQYGNHQSPASLYCTYQCLEYNTYFNSEYFDIPCRTQGEVCPLMDKFGCDMFEEPKIYPSLEQCYQQTLYYDHDYDSNTVQVTMYDLSKYLLVHIAMNWTSAEQYCNTMYNNSHLATVITAKDFEITKQLRGIYDWATSIWIGYNDRYYEGDWEWSDGTKCFTDTNIGCMDSDRWEKDQPDDWFGEDCAVLASQNNFLNDAHCAYKYIFFCNNSTWRRHDIVQIVPNSEYKTETSHYIRIIGAIVGAVVSVVLLSVCIYGMRKCYTRVCNLCQALSVLSNGVNRVSHNATVQDGTSTYPSSTYYSVNETTLCTHNSSGHATAIMLLDIEAQKQNHPGPDAI